LTLSVLSYNLVTLLKAYPAETFWITTLQVKQIAKGPLENPILMGAEGARAHAAAKRARNSQAKGQRRTIAPFIFYFPYSFHFCENPHEF
jgi:hypothetical protein